MVEMTGKNMTLHQTNLATAPEIVLALDKINKTYGGSVPTQVLFDIDLTFAAATFNGIIGQSGSGKST